jgi:hypothetical protein
MQTVSKSKRFGFASLLPIGLLLFFGWRSISYFTLACAVCSVFFGFLGLRLTVIIKKGRDAQTKNCKPIGYLLLIPSMGLIVAGIFVLTLPEMRFSDTMVYYLLVILSGILATLIFLQIAAIWKNESTAGKFLRLTLWASVSAPLSLIIVLSLFYFSPDEAALLGCMSAAILGGASMLTALNMILVSRSGYKSTADSIKDLRHLYKRHFLIFTRFTILKDAFLVAAKSVISVLATSFFMFVNALYSGGMGIARYVAIAMHKQDSKRKLGSYRLVGIIISISSICYALYSVRLFFGGSAGVYDMNVALVIALYTFVEFGINVKEAVKLRKSKALEAKALRAISFASTLICFVLTQTAIMSFAAEGDNSFSNALAGVVFGAMAAIVGLYVVFDSLSHRKNVASR